MHSVLSSEWLDRLKLTSRVGKELFTSAEQAAGLFCAQAIKDALAAGATGVFCVDGSPYAAVVSMPPSEHSDPKQLLSLYTVLWNQGELDFLLLLNEDSVEIHTLRGNPDHLKRAMQDGKEPPSLLDVLRFTEQAGSITELVSGLESGRLLQEYQTKITDERVDAELISDLEGARRILLNEDDGTTSSKECKEQVHDVLLQAMFLLYLEDRGIVGAKYIHAHCNSQADTLHDLLRHSPKDFRLLLRSLDRDCNGGLFADNALWTRHANTLADFLEGTRNFGSGQGRLLRIYHFDHIPVELLSEVYDRFLESEDGKKAHGAYYTPRRLAALVVEQVWETLRSYLDAGRLPRVLDPTCGSGIFLTTLFQRMAGHLRTPSWEDLKHLATCLHGLDINPTAIRISAFSLSLALLHRRTPKELQERMENEGNILPQLLHQTLHAKDFFEHPVNEQYDCIIGNPPWGDPKQQTESWGELWLDAQCVSEPKNKHKYPKPPNRERSWPFIWKSLEHLSPQAPLALLLPSTGFFLNDAKASLVRFLDFARIFKLIDLSDLRFVLFKNSTFSTSILHAGREDGRVSHTFAYVCPKADINATRGDRILLANEDWHQLSAWYFARNSVVATQRLMWMSHLEQRVLDFLDSLPTLRDLPLLESREARKAFPDSPHPAWGMGMGFQSYTGKGKPYAVPSLMTLPHAIKKGLTPWVQYADQSWEPYGKVDVVRKKFVEAFTGPHIVMPVGTKNSRLKASYAEHDFSFNNNHIGITVPDSEEGRSTGKFLTAFLNSALVAWFMGSIGLAVNRPRITPAVILLLPFPSPEDLPDPKQATLARAKIVAKMDALMQQAAERQQQNLKPYGQFPSVADIQDLDRLVFSYLGLRPEEISAIQENVSLIRKAAQPARNGVIPELWKEAGQQQWDEYSQHLGNALTHHMAENVRAVASVHAYSRDAAVVRITRQYKDANGLFPPIQHEKAIPLTNLPEDILQRLERDMGGNLYLQRCVLVVTEQYTYLIKPNQRRFWLASAAYTDADRLMNRLLQAAGPSRGAE